MGGWMEKRELALIAKESNRHRVSDSQLEASHNNNQSTHTTHSPPPQDTRLNPTKWGYSITFLARGCIVESTRSGIK